MTKKLIAIPEGNLMRVAATKSITTLTDLKEKTRVDRKTLRAINEGKPVKDTTLQSIADRLRVPLTHLLGPNTPDKHEDVSGPDQFGVREIKLQQLDATALRRLAGETDEINWFLNIDQISEELEKLLLRLRNRLNGWFFHVVGVEDPGMDDLENQISQIKMSADIDKSVDELAEHNLKIFGDTYVAWTKERDHPQELYYTSQLRVALSIAPKEKSNSTVRVYTGPEPPQQFDKDGDELAGIDFVLVDGKRVFERPIPF